MKQITFYRGAAISETIFILLAYFDDLEAPNEPFPRTVVIKFDAATGHWDELGTYEWRGQSIISYQDGSASDQFVVMSDKGDILIYTGTNIIEEKITDDTTIGMFGLTPVDEFLIAVGSGGYFYIRKGKNDWNIINSEQQVTIDDLVGRLQNLPDNSSPEYLKSLTAAISGTEAYYDVSARALDDIYISGEGGKILYWNGTDMSDVPTPTTTNLVKIIQQEEDAYIAIGSNPLPVIIKGTIADGFRLLYSGRNNEHSFTSISKNSDTILLTDINKQNGGLFYLNNDSLERYETTLVPEIGPAWCVDISNKALWVLEEKRLNRFMDGTWKRFEPNF